MQFGSRQYTLRDTTKLTHVMNAFLLIMDVQKYEVNSGVGNSKDYKNSDVMHFYKIAT